MYQFILDAIAIIALILLAVLSVAMIINRVEYRRLRKSVQNGYMRKTVQVTIRLYQSLDALKDAESHPENLHKEIANITHLVTDLYNAVDTWAEIRDIKEI